MTMAALAQRVAVRFWREASGDLWAAAIRDLRVFHERAAEVRRVDLKSPRGQELLHAFAFRKEGTVPTTPDEAFAKWAAASFLQMEVDDPDGIRPEGSLCLMVADGKRAPEVFYALLDAYEEEIQRVLDATAPVRFSYSGFQVDNPEHMGDKLCRALLEGVDFLHGLFKQRGVEKILSKAVSSVVLRPRYASDGNAAAYYNSHNRQIILTTASVSGNGRFDLKWINEVFLHEFGHYVHLTYMSPDAREAWNAEWQDVEQAEKAKEEAEDALTTITGPARHRFFQHLQQADFNPTVAAKKLKGTEKVQFGEWLRGPMTGDALITPRQFRPTPDGERVFLFFRNPQGFFLKYYGEERDEEDVKRMTGVMHKKLGLDRDDKHYISKDVFKEILSDPSMRKDIEEAIAKIQTVSDYGKTNAKEDFAETFVAFVANPAKLNPKAKFRMQRALSLSGLYGKPVMQLAKQTMDKLAERVAARFVVARRVVALRSVLALGPEYEGSLPLPEELTGHPALTEGMTELYPNPGEVGGWLGVIDGGPWIGFVGIDGKALLWTQRDPKGGVIGTPFEFRRDDLASAPTVTIPNPAFNPKLTQKQEALSVLAARYKKKKKVKTEGGDEMTVYEYSDRQIANRNKKKAERIEKLRKSIGSLRTKIKKDLKSSDPEKSLTALVVALIDHTYERVGNEGSAKDGHYGVTGWQKKHVTFSPKGATIRYVGKSGVKHEKKVTDAGIKQALRNAYEACDGDTSCLFSGDWGSVTAEKVNEYLDPFDVTAKDLRGFHANREMSERLKAVRSKGKKIPEEKKAREKLLKGEFLKALDETAEAVGHEASTLRSQYLVPGLEESYLKDGTVSDKLGSLFDPEGLMEDRVTARYLFLL